MYINADPAKSETLTLQRKLVDVESPAEVHDNLDVSVLQRTPNDLIHLIRKLRWMGMENEAKIMETELSICRVTPGDNVIGGPRDTD